MDEVLVYAEFPDLEAKGWSLETFETIGRSWEIIYRELSTILLY
jgi:hypothetical protein